MLLSGWIRRGIVLRRGWSRVLCEAPRAVLPAKSTFAWRSPRSDPAGASLVVSASWWQTLLIVMARVACRSDAA